ncbi:hypothetical protein CMV_008166 [Castanea mollissima]|uniref:Uncharacterized protein n=1 Tax=Castanea mollissima TaxID=60419 RepID=A0A8J4RKJ2_9ROSI|nr:hypothetical protein CMV_008166 [Castanea mollissima]
MKSELSLDLFMRLERGLDGNWAIVWSEVPRVGQVSSCSRDEEARSATTRGEGPVTGIDGEASSGADKAIIDAGKDLSGFSSPDTEMPHRLGFLDLGVTGDLLVGSDLVRNGPVKSNGLFPSVDLGNMLEVKLGEGETNVEEVDSVGALQAESGLIILPRESSGVVVSGCGTGENDNCVLDCEPLSHWVPNDPNVGTLTQDSIEGAQRNESGPHSDWVSKLMKFFCKMVGFPIVRHEAQCLALFSILE